MGLRPFLFMPLFTEVPRRMEFSEVRCANKKGRGVAASAFLLALIHPTSEKGCSAKFVSCEFSELRLIGLLRSSP
jgi:hypothetical protein